MWLMAGLLAEDAWAGAPQQRLLIMDFKAVGVDADLAAQATALAAQAVHGAPGFTVLSMEDVRALISAEAARSMLGCASDTGCAAQVAAAANVDLMVTGNIGRVGDRYTAALSLLDVAKGQVRAREQADAPTALALARLLDERMRRLLGLGEAVVSAPVMTTGKPVSLAVLDLVPAGVAEDVAKSLTQVLGTELRRAPGATVISRDDIQAMLQLEEVKLKMGCDDASCLAEIGGALGVEKLVAGNVGRLSGSYLITLRLISVKNTRVENRVTESFSGTEEQLIRAVRHAGRTLMGIPSDAAGTLAVGAAQAGAEVSIDGTVRGETPLKPVGALRAGPHTVVLRKGGYLEWSSDVYVDPADTSVLFVNLTEKPLRWYQRWQVWALTAGAAAVTVVTLAALASATSLLVFYVYRSTTAGPPPGSGSATID